MTVFTESIVEDAVFTWPGSLGWSGKNGAEIAPGEPAAQHGDYGQVIIARLNPDFPAEALEDAFRHITHQEGATDQAMERMGEMSPEAVVPGGEIVLYQSLDGEVQLDVRLERETVWLSLNQIAELFGRDKSVISRHLRNVFASGELKGEATVAKIATVRRERDREVFREIDTSTWMPSSRSATGSTPSVGPSFAPGPLNCK